MKNYLKIWLIILAMTISQQAFPQKENAKSPLTGEQQIELSEGYSFISSRIISENPDMMDVLQEILVNLDFVRNTAGLMLRKIGPNWINSIGDWVNTEGYIFRMNDADELTIVGDAIDPQTQIELSCGYQIIGYLPDQALNTEEVFQDVLENLEFVRNTAGMMFRKIGPVWINSIGDMQPGEGYLVKMYAGDVLIYPLILGGPCPGIPTVTYEGQVYNTVLIGDQCWLKENLNVGTMINGSNNQTDNGVIEKYCYNNDPANCEIYSGLYQWNEMMQYTTTQGVQGICPAGWYIPTDDELTTLTDFLGGENVAGGKMKETGTTHWNSPNTGATNESGFTALPAGNRSTNGGFFDLGSQCHFWSSSESSTNGAWYRKLSCNYGILFRGNYGKYVGFSVRCLLGEPINLPPNPPSSPNPENGAENQSIEVDLSWTCTDPEGDPLTYDIYLGTEATPPQVATGQTETTYNPGTLENNTEYFWKIVAHDDHSNTTEGPVWCFITEEFVPPPCPGIPTVTYEGQVYNTVLIGEQCWLKENLNVGTMINGTEEMTNNGIIEKYCYDNDPVNCDEYGGLYQWNEMMEYTTTPGVQGICPAGWHIPTDDEIKILEGTVDSQYPVGDPIWDYEGFRGFDAGLNLKSTSGWYNNGNGIDLFGFTALPGGNRDNYGGFDSLSYNTYFWCSLEVDPAYA